MNNDRQTDDEKAHSDAIEQEKKAYKETLDHLRGLKGTIESTQKVVEKGRGRLQSDFDTWYQHMCYKETRRRGAQPREEARAQKSVDSDSTLCKDAGKKEHGVEGRNMREDTADVIEQIPVKAPEQPQYKLPPGIQLTGNADADADIMAFYRAKEILLGGRR